MKILCLADEESKAYWDYFRKEKLAATIVGSWSAVAYAIENNNEQERCTHLAARLNELQNCA